MPGRPRTRARKAVEAIEGTLVGPGVSPRSTALALVPRIEDPVEARRSVLDMCLDLMNRAAEADAYIAAAAFANILLRELPNPGPAVTNPGEQRAALKRIVARAPGLFEELLREMREERGE